jgi:hypothetical protein
VCTEGVGDEGGQGDGSAGGWGLRFLQPEATPHLAELPAHGEGAALHVRPSEVKGFPDAEAAADEDAVEAIEPVPTGGLQELAGLVGREGVHFLAGDTRPHDGRGRIAHDEVPRERLLQRPVQDPEDHLPVRRAHPVPFQIGEEPLDVGRRTSC